MDLPESSAVSLLSEADVGDKGICLVIPLLALLLLRVETVRWLPPNLRGGP
jgi:hypothetical protein